MVAGSTSGETYTVGYSLNGIYTMFGMGWGFIMKYLIIVGITEDIQFHFSENIKKVILSGGDILLDAAWCQYQKMKIWSMSASNNLDY